MLVTMSGVRRLVFAQLVLVFVCLFVCPSTSDLSKHCSLDDLQNPRGVCGPRLSQLVASICQGFYGNRNGNGNRNRNGKRSKLGNNVAVYMQVLSLLQARINPS